MGEVLGVSYCLIEVWSSIVRGSGARDRVGVRGCGGYAGLQREVVSRSSLS